ncbi:F1 capsule-anchoring protein precursor [compost metagenome]
MYISFSRQFLLRRFLIKPNSISWVIAFHVLIPSVVNASTPIASNKALTLSSTTSDLLHRENISQLKNNTQSGQREYQSQEAETLLVEIIINTQRLPDIYRIEKLQDGRLVLPLEVWHLTRLKPVSDVIELVDKNQGYALDSIQGLSYSIDQNTLTLEIYAPIEAFQTSSINIRPKEERLPKSTTHGVFINYDLSAVHTDRHQTSYAGLMEGIVFNDWGTAMLGAVVRVNEHNNETIRTDTYWQKDLPAQMQSLVIGDTIDFASDWSRPARFAGFRWGRDFSLQPGYISYPMPSISGSAALPSTIDILVNNQKTQMQTVNSGPFDLTNIPVVTGSGELNLIVRNLLGQQTLITKSYYTSPKLLEKDVVDFSFQAGFLRENYGVKSNDYGAFFSSGLWRQGLSKLTTVEGRFELQEDRQAIGGIIDQVLGDFALVRLGGGISNDKDHQGGHYLVGLERTSLAGAGSIRWEYFDKNYHQFASIEDEIKPRERIIAGYGLPVSKHISAGLNYTSQSDWDGDLFQLLSVSLSISFPENIFLNTYATKNLDTQQGWSGGLSLTIPLDKQRSAASSIVRDSSGQQITTIELNQSVPSGLGFGWGLRASDDPQQRLYTNLVWNTNKGQLVAEAVENSDWNTSVRLAANGTVGWFNHLFFATQNLGQQSFAVVKVGDFADIPIYRSNQLAAHTNNQGLALIPNLLPYQENKISIDPTELPLDAEIQGIEDFPQPYARSGIFVNLPVRRSHNILMTILQADNAVVPLGAKVKIGGRTDEFIVGKRGEVYLIDLVEKNHMTVTWENEKCELEITPNLNAPHGTEFPPLICAASQAVQP